MSVSELEDLKVQSSLHSRSVLTTVAVTVAVVAALYFGREVFVPIALAMLLSFVLAPAVRFLQRTYMPRGLAVLIVALLAFSTIIGLGAFLVGQVTDLANELPRYQSTLREKIQNLRGATSGSRTFDRASEVLQDLRKEIEKPNSETPNVTTRDGTAPGRPIPVEVKETEPSALQNLAMLLKSLIAPLTTTGLVVIFLIFILMRREDLRNRLIRLSGIKDLQRTTVALDDAATRLSRLFLTQLALNAAFGVVIGAGLAIIGVPSAALWGALAMIMRFVPYVGAVISAIFPLMLAAAVGPDWTMMLWTGALFVVVEPVVGHVIEPLVYGHSAGLSPIAVITAATFWTWLWGPIGLVLATPLTLCLVVLGRHVDRLEFLDVMFGDQPPLTPAELLYQRLLAADPVEATEQARACLKEHALIDYYDDILLKGLKLAQTDADRGLLKEKSMERIRDGVAEIVDDLAAHEDNAKKVLQSEKDKNKGKEDTPSGSPLDVLDKNDVKNEPPIFLHEWKSKTPVLCLPGVGLLDEAAAMVIVQLLERRGLGARIEPVGALSMTQIFNWDTKDVALVCLCYVENVSSAQVRYAVRRIRRRAPDAAIMVALLGNPRQPAGPDMSVDGVLIEDSLRRVTDRILELAQGGSVPSVMEPTMALAS
jgi:predicted PurR-regulated permease PerM